MADEAEDIASLGIEFKTNGVDEAKASMDAATKSGKGLEDQLETLAAANSAVTKAEIALAVAAVQSTQAQNAYEKAVSQAAKATESHSSSAYGLTGYLSNLLKPLGLTTNSSLELAHAARSVTDEFIATGNITRSLGEELPRVTEALSLSSGSGKLLGAVFSETGIAIAGTIATVAIGVGIFAAFSTVTSAYNKALQELTATSAELGATSGLTGEQLENLAEKAASSNGTTVASARASATAFVSAGQVSSQAILDLTAAANDYADVTGVKAADANKVFAQAISDPSAAAKEYNGTLVELTSAQLDQIDSLQASGDKMGAVTVLAAALKDAQDKAKAAAGGHEGALKSLGATLSQAASWIAGLDHQLSEGSRYWFDYYAAMTGDKEAIADLKRLGDAAKAVADIKATAPLIAAQAAGSKVTDQYDLSGSNSQQALKDQLKAVNTDIDAQRSLLNIGKTSVADYNAEMAKLSVTQDGLNHAVKTYIPDQQLTIDKAKDAQKLAATDPSNKAAVAAIKADQARLDSAGKVITQSQADQLASIASASALDKYTKAKQAHVDTAGNYIKEEDASAAAQLGLVEAASKGTASELVANAVRAASVEAIQKHLNATQALRNEQDKITIAIGGYAVTQQKALVTDNDRVEVMGLYAAKVQAGTLNQADANAQAQIELTTKPILAAALQAEGPLRQKLLDIYDQTKASLSDLNSINNASALDASNKSLSDQLSILQSTYVLIGATNTERATELAAEKAMQDLAKMPGGSNITDQTTYDQLLPAQKEYLDNQVKVAAQTVKNTEATADFNKGISKLSEDYAEFASRASDGASGLASAFGTVGKSIGDLGQTFVGLAATIQKNNEALTAYQLQTGNYSKDSLMAHETDMKNQTASQAAFGKTLDAAQEFFKAGSAGYQILGAASGIYHATELAMSIASIASHAEETASAIASGASQAAAWTAAAVAHAFAELGPIGGAVAAAAIVGAVAALGVAVSSGGSTFTSSTPDPTNTGTGTSGDGTTQSASLQKSLDNAQKYQDNMLDYSSKQVTALQAIETGIDNLTITLGRSITVSGGALDVSGVKTGTSVTPAILGLFGGSSSTSTLQDNGLSFTAQNLEDIVTNGVKNATSYIDVQTQKTSSGFLGIGGGTKTSDKVTSSTLDSDIDTQIQQVIGSLQTGVLQAASQLGVTGAQAALDSFTVNLGKISFKGMTADQIQTQLNSVFSALGDQIAQKGVGFITTFSKVGEGALQTLERVATDYGDVNDKLTELGNNFVKTGVAFNQITITERLVDLAGGLDNFNTQADFFTQNFLTQAQQIAPIAKSVQAALDGMGLSGVKTTTDFANVVEGLDIASDAGSQEYSQLMALAPAFLKVAQYNDTLNGTVTDTADLLAKQITLQIDLYNALGDTNDATALQRKQTLDGTDASLKALQQQVFDAQDAATAAANYNTELGKQNDLQVQLYTALGDTNSATALQRQLALAAISDPTEKSLQQQIYTATDATAAQTALAKAQSDAAATASTLAASQISLQEDLLNAQGNSAAATALQRQQTLAATDDSLKSLQQQVFDAQDAAAANDALAKAQSDAATAAQTLASAQEGLDTALGNTAAATALQRQAELAAITDPQVRSLTLATYAASDLTAAYKTLTDAQTAAASAVTSATTALSSAQSEITTAYNSQASSINSAISSLQDLQKQLSTFADSTASAGLSPQNAYANAQAKFNSDVNTGDTADLTTDAQSFLDNSKSYNASGSAYQQDLLAVQKAVAAAQQSVGNQISADQQQLSAAQASVSQLVDLNGNTVTLTQAIADYYKAQNDLATAKAKQDQANSDTQTNVLQQVLTALQASLGQNAAISAADQASIQALADQLSRNAAVAAATTIPALQG